MLTPDTPIAPFIRRLIVGAALVALPQVILARAADAASPPCPPPEANGPHAPQGMPEDPPPPPGMPPDDAAVPPGLRGLALSEAQRDAVFELLHAQQPTRRTLEKKARRALEALQRLAASDAFAARAARTLADDYAQAIAELAFNRAQCDAQLRTLLSAQQRQRLDAPPPDAPRPPPGAPGTTEAAH